MKALLVTHDFPPLGGGIARYNETLARCWPPEELVVLAPAIPGSATADGAFDCRVLRRAFFPRVPTASPAREMPALLRELRAAVREERPDVLLCAQALTTGAAAWLGARRIPSVVFAHGEELLRPRRSAWRAPLMGAVLRRALAVVVVSDYGRRETERYGVAPERILRATGVELARYRPPAAEEPAEEEAWRGLERDLRGARLLLAVGRLERRKGHDLLLRALAQVAAAGHDARLVVVGRGEERAALESLARELGVAGRFRLIESVSEPVLARLYRRADLLCLGSRAGAAGQEEGLGLVLVEAAAAGTPAVATRVGGTADAVADGVTGLLVPPDDPAAFAAAARALLADEAARRAMGERARARAEERFDARRNFADLRRAIAARLAARQARGGGGAGAG